MEPILEVKNLAVTFDTYGGSIHAVRNVDFDLMPGECVAIVGESGCGKSVTAKSIMRLIGGKREAGHINEGEILFEGRDLLRITEKEMQAVRGDAISMIFQDPMTSLNPTMTIGKQIAEVLIKHQHLSKTEALEKTVEYLKLVGIPSPEKRVKEYPDSLSGGMRQRVMIAIAMCCNPRLLIADEPTTALDVTIQAQILELMQDLQKKFNTAIILITHDLGVVANMASRVMVFYAGKIVEEGKVEDVFYRPKHPYTWGLLKSMPKLNAEKRETLISIEGTPPDLFAPPKGCAFHARCPYAMVLCKKYQPDFIPVGDRHCSACWLNLPETPEDCKPHWLSAQKITQKDIALESND